ncbi:MAG: TIR domain-containing protein [Methylovirgula sp.]
MLIAEGDEDSDVYLLVAGSCAIRIKGVEAACRKAGEPVGEMAAIEPQQRSATVIARETVVAVKMSANDFAEIGKQHPEIWLPLARILSRRLLERNKFMGAPNAKPRLFVISSSEAREVAFAIRDCLTRSVTTRVWTDGTFFAGDYNLEALERAVEESDFAIAIAQPDDIVESRGSRSATLRDNVLFELGLFMGRLTRHRAILVHPKIADLKLPSDLSGLTKLGYDVDETKDLKANVASVCKDVRHLVRLYGVRTREN